MTLPLVSMPSDSGVTSSSRTSLTSPFSTPAWTAAPMATTSSGLTPLWASLPGQALDQLLDGGDPGGPADQHHVVDVGLGQPGVGDGLVEGALARRRPGRR